MIEMYKMKVIALEKLYTSNLGMNFTAEELIEKISSEDETIFKLDFDGIKFMTMAFAQEYIYQKNKTDKTILEINVSKDVSDMLEYVKRRNDIKI